MASELPKLKTDFKLIDEDMKEYPLEIDIRIFKRKGSAPNYMFSVKFPPTYPDTEFHKYSIKEYDNNVAFIMITYSKNILHLDNFYVYSNFDKIKDLVNKGEILKGFGRYMLCRVLSYLMEIIPEITLSAWGDQCYNNSSKLIEENLDLELKDDSSKTKFEILLKKLEEYSLALFFLIYNNKKLKTKLEQFINIKEAKNIYENPYNFIHNHSLLNTIAKQIVLESSEDPEILESLKDEVCKLITN